MSMSIGIIGAGNIGLAVAKTLSRAGITATIANSRGPDSLKESLAVLGPTIKAGTREQAASADIVLIAVNWSKLPAAVAGLPAWGGRIVIDANNPIEAPLFKRQLVEFFRVSLFVSLLHLIAELGHIAIRLGLGLVAADNFEDLLRVRLGHFRGARLLSLR